MLLRNVLKYSWLLLAVLWSSSSISQSKNNEATLMAELRSSKNLSDSARIGIYCELIEQLSFKDPTEALDTAQKALAYGINFKDSVLISKVKLAYGQALNRAAFSDSGFKMIVDATHTFERLGNHRLAGDGYNVLARMNRYYKNYDQALSYYEDAMKHYNAINDDDGRATIYNESAVVYHYLNNFEEAIKRNLQALSIQQNLNNVVGQGYSYEFLGLDYAKSGHIATAEKYLRKALQIRLETKDSFAIASNYTNLAELMELKNAKNEAIDYYKKSLFIAENKQMLHLMRHIYKQLGELLKQSNDFQTALIFNQKYQELNDSLFNSDKNKEILQLNARYESEKAKTLIKEQEYKIKQRNTSLAILILSILLILAAVFFYFKRKKLQHQNAIQKVILEQQEIATRAMLEAEEEERIRIGRDLHDGVGQLLSVAKMNLGLVKHKLELQGIQDTTSVDTAIDLVDQSCSEVRSVSHSMMPNALVKKSLIVAVRDFLDVIDRKLLEVHLLTDGLDQPIDPQVQSFIFRIIQESVNNVIKHAQASRLDISIIVEQSQIDITIEDNGIGMKVTHEHNLGIGLKNIKSRVAYLNGHIDISSNPCQGTSIVINIPI